VKIALFSVLLLTLLITLPLSACEQLVVHFLDVGQADSILLELPDGQNLLIDAGNRADGDLVVDYIKARGINRLDYVIGTHPHEDHIGGLAQVIHSFDIGRFYMPRVIHTSKTFEDLLIVVKDQGIKIKTARAGVNLIEQDQLKAYFLSPVRDHYDNLNHWSAVLQLIYGNTSFLFTGDTESINEFEMLTLSSKRTQADVLKVGHHGSDSSTTEHFLKALNSSYAVISVGKDNPYGHPSPVVLKRLQEHGVVTFRTDELGTIKCYSDGEKIRFDKAVEEEGLVNRLSTPISTGTGVEITLVDLKGETVVIKNNSNKKEDISGWKLVSVKGEQSFIFPAGTFLESGASITVATGRKAKAGPRVIIWTKAYIWNNDGDPAQLYDDQGKLVEEYY